MFDIRKVTFSLLFIILIVFILYVGRGILIPLVWAIIIWYLIKGIRDYIKQLPFIGKRLPDWIINIFATLSFIGVFVLILSLVINNANDLVEKLASYKISENLSNILHSDLLNSIDWKGYETTLKSNATTYISDFTTYLSSFFSYFFLVILYTVFVFSESANFKEKLTNTIQSKESLIQYVRKFREIDESITTYLVLKTFVSIITASITFLILLIIGVDAPFFWAFLVFLMNFIPSIGSLIATIFPTIMAFIQFGDWLHPILVLSLVGLTQVIVGNFIEPKIMGKSLNLSTLVVMLSLSFWSALWGITGAILSVPIMVILILLFKQFDTTRPIARLLSEKGKL